MFNLISEIYRSYKKSKTIKKLTKDYLQHKIHPEMSAFDALNSNRVEKRNEALNKIIEQSLDEPNIQPVIKKFKINKVKLQEAFQELEMLGCAQYAKGHYVSISSLLYAQTLEYIFYQNRSSRVEKEKMAFTLIDYFDKNKTGDIVDIDYK
jgi:hypothetical protein